MAAHSAPGRGGGAAAQAASDKIQLVWSGIENDDGTRSRETGSVVQELFRIARRRVLVASYVLDPNGAKARAIFGELAARRGRGEGRMDPRRGRLDGRAMRKRTRVILESSFTVFSLLLLLNIVILVPAWCRQVLPSGYLDNATYFLPFVLAIAVHLVFHALGADLIQRSGAYTVPGIIAIIGWLPAALVGIEMDEHWRLAHQPRALDITAAEATAHREAVYMRLRDGRILTRCTATHRESVRHGKDSYSDAFTHVAPVVTPDWSPPAPVRVWAVSTRSAPDFHEHTGPVAGVTIARAHDSHRQAMARVEARCDDVHAAPAPVLLRLDSRSYETLLAHQQRRVRIGFLLANGIFAGTAIGWMLLGFVVTRRHESRRLPRARLRKR